MTASTYSPPFRVPWTRFSRTLTSPVVRMGHMLVFFIRAVAAVPIVLRHYRTEFARLLSDITWG